jgi:hypothetical protein
MNEIAEIMGAVTNCAVAGIQAGRDIGKAERDKLERQRDEAVRLLKEYLVMDMPSFELDESVHAFLATLDRTEKP